MSGFDFDATHSLTLQFLYSHQACFNLIQNTAKTVIFKIYLLFKVVVFYFKM